MPKKYINPEILKSRFTNGYDDYFPLWKIEMFIDDAPAADMEEAKHGEWINEHWCDDKWYHTCSNCNTEIVETFFDFYCPNCGAKMEFEKVQK